MIKYVLVLVLSAAIAFNAIPVYAESVNLYASIDDSNSTANLLGDLMRNDSAYDPYNEYVILRAGERDYRCYFGPDLQESSICLTYIAGSMGSPASLSRRVVSSGLSIVQNGYWVVGNIEGSVASSSIETYKTNYVLVIVALAIVIFLLFKFFRRERSSGDRYYRVR